MGTIFENIGFDINCEDDVFRLADFALHAGKIILVSGGFYVCYQNASGSEVWCRIAANKNDDKTELLNIDPHFNGANFWRLKVGQSLGGDDFLDGKFVLHTEDETKFITSRVMGHLALKEFCDGARLLFQVAMVPSRIVFFDSEEAYREESGDCDTLLGVLFAYGMYSRLIAVEDEDCPQPDILTMRVLARVTSCEPRQMQLDGESFGGFYHLTLETQLGPLDVASRIKCEPNDIALVTGAMSAKVINDKDITYD